jgi:hypothetical protein
MNLRLPENGAERGFTDTSESGSSWSGSRNPSDFFGDALAFHYLLSLQHTTIFSPTSFGNYLGTKNATQNAS